MASAEDLYTRWRQNPPSEVSRGDFEKVVRHYLGDFLREGSGSSHQYVVSHEALRDLPATRQFGIWAIPLKSGRAVKGYYVKQLIAIVEHLCEEGLIP